ncbi:glycosyl hydrolase [Streptomyces physcomitrii]|uniref:glycoside hydrolase family 26 protein n=1 Tax=Streptomyces physcomitrii TaxID=2724184 RepID=UPI0033E8A789
MKVALSSRKIPAVLAALALSGGAWLTTTAPGSAAPAGPPVSPAGAAATPEDVVGYLQQISGQQVVSGVHNKEPLGSPTQYTDKAESITGKRAGLWGGEVGFTASDVADRQRIVDQAKTEWDKGSLVSWTWHMCPPTKAEDCAFDGDINGYRLDDGQWADLVDDGGGLNTVFKERLDGLVPYLQQLKDAGVPLLFRPQHEMNEGWAWWGGRGGENGSRKLFRITHDYLESKGLDNIVWVWNVKDPQGQAGSVGDYYPGDDYVDVVSLDPWNSSWPTDDWYQAMKNVAPGKPLSLAEVGRVPSPGQLASQPEWTWFMVWAEYLDQNSGEELRATFNDGRTLNQGGLQLPGLGVRTTAGKSGE